MHIKTSGIIICCLFVLLSFAGNVFAAPQETCPVMGGKINTEIYADYEGKRVYFCCEACIPTFKEDPEKYLAKLKEMGVEPEEVSEEGKDKAEEPKKTEEDKEHGEEHGKHEDNKEPADHKDHGEDKDSKDKEHKE